MTPHVRKLAVALVCALLLVPAATRVGQALHAARASTAAPSFSKSVDVPREPTVIVPDLTPQPLEIEARIEPLGRSIPADDEAIPPLPVVADSQSLRAPPACAVA